VPADLDSFVPPREACAVAGLTPFRLREIAFPPPGAPARVRTRRAGGRTLVHLGDVVPEAKKAAAGE
jgi:hypothetical protein